MKSTAKHLQKGGKVSASKPMMPPTDANNRDKEVIKSKLSSSLSKLAKSKMMDPSC